MAPKAALPMLLHVPKRLRPLRDVCCMGAALRWQRRAWNVCAGFSRPPVGKAWNSKQMAGIHSCHAVRALFAAEGNVAHGRGQRCTRPGTTLHTAGDNVAHGRVQRTIKPLVTRKPILGRISGLSHTSASHRKNRETRTESISCLAYSRGHRRIVPRSRACLQHRRPCKPGAGMGGGYEEENACVRYLFLSNTEYVFHLGQFVSTKCWGLGSGQTLAKLLGAAGAHND